MITIEKIKENKEYIDKNGKTLAHARHLYSALQSWDKKTVNKTFFEYHFTKHDENGNIKKDWKGNVSTMFSFSDKAYEWHKYAKRIHLAGDDYVEVPTTDTFDVCEATRAMIATLEARNARYEATIATLEAIDESRLIRDIRAVYEAHGRPMIWQEALASYEVKYPDNK